MQHINDKMNEKAIENGIISKDQFKFNFKEFDILDMYRLDDGSMCF